VNGTVSGTPPNVTYTPRSGFSGSDSFGFTVSDGKGGTASGNVAVAVTAGAATPELSVKSYGATGNGSTDDTAAFRAALTAATALGQTVRVPGNATYRISGALRVPAGVALACDSAATLRKHFSGEFLIMENNSKLQGCTLDGNRGSGFSTHGLISIPAASGVTVEKNAITNASRAGILIGGGARSLTIVDNQITGCGYSSILSAGPGVANVTIARNRITQLNSDPDSDPIQVWSLAPTAVVRDWTVEDNVIQYGSRDATQFCIEIGDFGGLKPENIKVLRNQCRSVSNNYGGVSFSAVVRGVIEGNTFDSTGVATSIGGIELVWTDTTTVRNNTVLAGNNPHEAIALSATARSLVETNTLRNVIRNGIRDYCASVGTARCEQNVIKNNNVYTAAPKAIGIVVESNSPGAISVSNTVSGNNVYCSAGWIGVSLHGYSGVMDSHRVTDNTLHGCSIAVNSYGAVTRLFTSNNILK
jgi:polygalacturonase